MTDNPYAAPRDAEAPVSTSSPKVSAASDDPMAVGRMVFEDVKNNPVGYALSGVSQMAFVVVSVLSIVAVILLGIAPGIALEDELLLFGGSMLGIVLYTGGILALSFLVIPLQMASLIRALHDQMEGKGSIGVMSPFRTMGKNAVRVVLFYLLYQTTVLIGAMLLYIPGLAAAAIGNLVMPIVVLEPETSIADAYTRGIEHFKDNLGWHLGVWLTLFIAILVLEITFVGLLILMPVMTAWQVAAYRIALAPERA